MKFMLKLKKLLILRNRRGMKNRKLGNNNLKGKEIDVYTMIFIILFIGMQ
jgi:hypothetical protein